MVSSAAFTIAIFLVAQPADELRLRRGEELVYRGTYVETATHSGAEYHRTFELENRIFVRTIEEGRYELAVLTTLKPPNSGATAAVRFALMTADRSGRVRLKSGGRVPFVADGPPKFECVGLIERPSDGPQDWTALDSQPPFVWRRIGYETRRNVRCLKLAGVQQSDNWDRIAADRPAWRRQESAWVSGLNGIVERLERESEWRCIGERDSVVRATTTYELHGGVSIYPDPLGEDRRTEVNYAAGFQQELHKLLTDRAPPERFERLIGRIDTALGNSPATPFRPAILTLRQQAEAARRGETPAPDTP